MATNEPISALDPLAAADVASDDLLVVVDVGDTSSSPSGTTKNLTIAALLNNPSNGEVAGYFVPSADSAAVGGGIVQTAQNGMTFQSQGGTLTDFNFLDPSGDFLAAMRKSDGALMGGKLMGVSAAPTIVANAGAGTGATATVVGSDTAGLITLTTGTGVVAGQVQCTLTFSVAFANGAAPNVTYSFPDGSVNNYPPLAAATTVTQLQIATLGTGVLSDSTVYRFNYQVLGYGN